MSTVPRLCSSLRIRGMEFNSLSFPTNISINLPIYFYTCRSNLIHFLVSRLPLPLS